ncbi:hypothetical protein [Escherichia coli]|uniref:hypothetical protein n=1 Tax=Escherichia coli TaxID=562 RepID=UPI001379629D|nr:hypothetical protein [Escherichia coli]
MKEVACLQHADYFLGIITTYRKPGTTAAVELVTNIARKSAGNAGIYRSIKKRFTISITWR